uniref:(northern house mosquito) hypothetical protein n=1 Tax=Culex pipiens TaxID=7175 RepID=A0A8D8FDH0_CULPI
MPLCTGFFASSAATYFSGSFCVKDGRHFFRAQRVFSLFPQHFQIGVPPFRQFRTFLCRCYALRQSTFSLSNTSTLSRRCFALRRPHSTFFQKFHFISAILPSWEPPSLTSARVKKSHRAQCPPSDNCTSRPVFSIFRTRVEMSYPARFNPTRTDQCFSDFSRVKNVINFRGL